MQKRLQNIAGLKPRISELYYLQKTTRKTLQCSGCSDTLSLSARARKSFQRLL